jgi:hypothetical protein
MATHTHDPFQQLSEIRNQLSYVKRLGFLFGAGTSKALGVSDISALTKKIEENLSASSRVKFQAIKASLHPDLQHVEGILNNTRLIRQLTSDAPDKEFESISGEDARSLDKDICGAIYDIITKEEEAANMQVSRRFINWLNWLPRDFAKEIFTTNYDLILEKSFEHLLIPFYDGFIGSHEPFFNPESIETKSKYDRPPLFWIRLWKLHGSLGWFWKIAPDAKSQRIIRLSCGAKALYPDSELVIYPSRDKYESSRKQPFTSYFDRLKDFLLAGEGMFIVSGYSFSDAHINEILFNTLNQNNRLHMICFFFDEKPLDMIVGQGKNVPNLTLIGPKKASISGITAEWDYTQNKGDLVDNFWDEENKQLTIGDFKQLVQFLIFCTGVKDKIDVQIKTA